MTSPSRRRAHVVGLGLIGGSVALALEERGWAVTGRDLSPVVTSIALERGVVTDDVAADGTELVVIATPSHSVITEARRSLDDLVGPSVVVTDVAGVKGPISSSINDPRFIGGHPMAGSELRGLDGARGDLFTGCTWVLTPSSRTDPATYSRLHGVLRELDANVVALDADTHDRLVAVASHVPHLVAGALMNEASLAAESDQALLQLAAGGFRDMTRVSAGDPHIWPDVLIENSSAVVAGLRSLRDRLAGLEKRILDADRAGLMDSLTEAAQARRDLPGRAVPSAELTHLRVPVPDRPGVLAEVTTTASELGVNIYDIEIAHSVEGQPGVIMLTVERASAERFARALEVQGHRVAREDDG
jgi:prephenate dehydrogenase